MSDYTRFYFVSVGTPRTHLAGWSPAAGEWVIPCGTIRLGDSQFDVEDAPTKPLCLTCIDLTSDPSPAPRTRRR